MTQELGEESYSAVRTLFRELSAYNAALPALLDRVNPGCILADDPGQPRSAIARTPEGFFLAGDPQNAAFVADANAWLVETFFNDESTVAGGGIFLRIHPKDWQERVPALFRPREPMTLVGRHYLLTELRLRDWRDRIPHGFTIHHIDAAILDDPAIKVPADVLEQIAGNWGSRERFLEHGFGLCAIHEDRVTHWSMADCATSDGHCEIGVGSLPAFRRRGLAAITAAASVEHALAGGFVRVGWQCSDDNVGSIRTAERIGFVLERVDTSYYCMFSSVHQEAESGWYHLRNGRTHASAAAYERLFALAADLPDLIYHTAARAFAATGRTEAALRCLREALVRGWTHVEFTVTRCPEFEALRGTQEWGDILERMAGGEP